MVVVVQFDAVDDLLVVLPHVEPQLVAEPGMVQHVVDTRPRFRVGVEHVPKQVGQALGDVLGLGIIAIDDAMQNLGHQSDPRELTFALTHEGIVPGDHRVQHDAARPDLGLLAVVLGLLAVPGDQLGRQVQHGPHARLEGRLGFVLRQTKITKLENLFVPAPEEQVLQLDIPVDDPQTVAEVDGEHQLLQVPARSLFRKAPPLLQEGEQVAPLCVLQYQNYELGRRQDLFQPDHVRMLDAHLIDNLP